MNKRIVCAIIALMLCMTFVVLAGMQKHEVIDKTTKQVKRWGYCDFTQDGSFDTNTEEQIIHDFVFDPDIDETNWYWNGSTFTTTPQ